MLEVVDVEVWNPWHGCRKISAGCRNCYVYRMDEQYNKDSSKVEKTSNFKLPLQKNRKGEYKLNSSPVYLCLTSDFFIEEADEWRDEIWEIIKTRSDLEFVIITKRIHRFRECIPSDWDDGYDNVRIICTCENQDMADYRLPIFVNLPIKHKEIIHEPMLEEIHVEEHLKSGQIELVTCGGESGDNARECDYSWVLSTRKQCMDNNVSFYFKQTGAHFVKDGVRYNIARKNQMSQASKANIDYYTEEYEKGDSQSNKGYSRYERDRSYKELGSNKKNESNRSKGNSQRSKVYRSNGSQKSSGNNRSFVTTSELDVLFERLARSDFRSSFYLKQKDIEYIKDKGLETIRTHAYDFISKRLAPAYISNDGKQTPMKGHPVFVAQHATATCCRGCLMKWHAIPMGVELTKSQQDYVVEVIMKWIERNSG